MLSFDVCKFAFLVHLKLIEEKKTLDFMFSLLPQLYIVNMLSPVEVLKLKFNIWD